ncbi:hypothetical protein FH972_022216 [Carpinus fangiana]|uniref:Phosphoinositide phospholipase C n=1 Tax=Carpinus fangiana TaxID=176857 RepID=A0A5N6KS47_9ROSI|nr:hypothetical protein FH972_022216 [Carpinus fangiana]
MLASMSTPSVTSPAPLPNMNPEHTPNDSMPFRHYAQANGHVNGTTVGGVASPSASFMSRVPSTISTQSTHSRSVPATPDGPIAASPSEMGSYTPLLLPKTPSAITPTATAVADAGNVGRQKGIMRRLSRSTGNRLRRGTSSNNMREQASGSVVVRQPTDSRLNDDVPFDVSDYELDDSDDGKSATTHTKPRSISRSSTSTGRPFPRQQNNAKHTKNAVVPSTSLDDLQGKPFVKYTRRKRKDMHFFLHQRGARLSWSTSRDKTKGKSLYLDHIRELRYNAKAQTYLKEFGLSEEMLDRWLTITYIDSEGSKGRATKSLHLLAPNRKIRDSWVEWLDHVMYTRGDMMAKIAGISDEHREKVWISFVNEKPHGTLKEERECMSFSELRAVCRKWAINKAEKDLRERFDKVDTRGYGYLGKAQFLELFRNMAERRDLKFVFDSIKSDQSPFLQQDDFMKFLRDVQGVDVAADRDYWVSVFDLYQATTKSEGIDQAMPQFNPVSPLGMSWQTFQDFMVSDHLAWDASPREDVKLTRPLNEYWISSSHNTYLKGRQVYGTSDAEEYVDALKKGCRSVEIDCWDGSDGQPIVTHGRTWTTKSLFEACIDRVNRYAFHSSPYPLSISLEVHCNAAQQAIMAEIMKRHFGSKMLLVPLRDNEFQLPAPEELKGRILIKVKKPAQTITTGNSLAVPGPPLHRRQRSQSEPNPRLRRGQTRKMSGPNTTSQESFSAAHPLPPATFPIPETDAYNATALTSGASSVDGTNSEDSDIDPLHQSTFPKKAKQQSKIVPVLGELGVYLRGVKISSFTAPEAKEYNHIFSFNETTFEEHCREAEEARLLEDHNMKYLMRVYPRGSRIESSNFDPIRFWRRGVQMVATNWQTHDLGTQINDAMFAVGSDRTGYVLKPEGLRPGPHGSPPRPLTKKRVKFSIDIISARRLPRPGDLSEKSEMSPYVEVEVLMADDPEEGQATGAGGSDASAHNGKAGIGAPLKKRTKINPGNGFDPIWYQPLEFSLDTLLPDLVFLRFSVFNSVDGVHTSNAKEPLATFTAKLCTLPQGFRHFSLKRRNNDKLLSQLFCRIRKEEVYEIGPRSEASEGSIVDAPRTSMERSSGKDFLRGIFQRTPSHSRKGRKDYPGGGLMSRTTSTER